MLLQHIPMGANDTVDLLRYVGEQLRALRDADGKLQSEVAKAARQCGFHWSAATVAAVELGRRQLSIEEFLSLPYILNEAEIHIQEGEKPRVVELAELLPAEGWVRISPVMRIHTGTLLAIVRGKYAEITLPQQDTPARRKARLKMIRFVQRERFTRNIDRMKEIQYIWPGAEKSSSLLTNVEYESQDETEIKAGRKLGVTPFVIALAARKLWGHSLTAERDRLVALQRSEDLPHRRLQALRGHATRHALSQIEPLVAGLRPPASAATAA